MTPDQRHVLASLDREAKIAAAKAYRAGWRRGGDQEGRPAAVQALVEHGLDLEDARVAATYVIHAASVLAPDWFWRRQLDARRS